MSSCIRNNRLRHMQSQRIQLHHASQVSTFSTQLSAHYITLCDSIIVPVFCACMIAAMGLISGLRRVVFMQFDPDADTEHITRGVSNRLFAALCQTRLFAIEKT